MKDFIKYFTGLKRNYGFCNIHNGYKDESGKIKFEPKDYGWAKKELQTKIKESLNNLEGNRGVYREDQLTQGGNVPSDDNMIYQVSPGKAYVRGYEVEIKSPQFLDVPKPRTARTMANTGVTFDFAPTLAVNNVTGNAPIGFNTTNTLSLRSQRVGTNKFTNPGEEIGKARIYDFALESGSYDVANPNINQWDLSIFDIEFKNFVPRTTSEFDGYDIVFLGFGHTDCGEGKPTSLVRNSDVKLFPILNKEYTGLENKT